MLADLGAVSLGLVSVTIGALDGGRVRAERVRTELEPTADDTPLSAFPAGREAP